MINKLETYTASDVVTVDEKTKEFIESATEIEKFHQNLYEQDRIMTLQREMFTMGANDFLNHSKNYALYSSSDAYFDGYVFAKKNFDFKRQIENEALRMFPKPETTTPFLTSFQLEQIKKNIKNDSDF